MVFVNIICSLFLLGSLLFYKFVFPRKKINLLFLLFLIFIFSTLSIFRAGSYESGDFNIHIYRTMDFFKSLTDGNLMPSWAENLNATYGYPLFIFNYTLPYYIISLFHWIGFSFIGSLKMFLAFNIALSGIFMFLFTKKLFKKDLPAFVSSIFYVFAPYHLIDIHFKVVIGEILFFTVLPLAFLSAYELRNKKNLFSVLILALSFAALIMSHLAIAIFAGILMLFFIFLHSSKNDFKTLSLHSILGFSISLIISSYTWLGPLLLSKYSYIQNIILKTAYFPTIQDLLYSPWRMGLLFQGPKGEISFLLGYAHLFIIAFTLFLICKKKILKEVFSDVLFWLITFFITVFLILPCSKTLWENLPIIKVVGSHRLLILTSFTSSIIAGYFAFIVKKRLLIYLLVFVAIVSTILNWGQRRVIPEINDAVLQKNLEKSTSETEGHFYANTKWVDIKHPWFSITPNNHLQIINDTGKISDISRTSVSHKYTITAKTPLKIQENTLYFPGWKGFINGREIFLSPSNKGIINANIPKGTFTFEVIYEDIFIYKLLKIISLSAFIITTICLIIIKIRPSSRL